MGSVLLAFGLIYSILPSITGRTLSRKLGAMHLILTNLGGFGLAFLFLFLGFAGFIRREGEIPSEFAWAMPWLMFFALIVGFGQIVFAYNFFQTLKRKTKTSDEEQFGEDQIKRSVKEQNSYINEQGDIVNTELLLQGTEEVVKII
jgi:heme/copper-type cytochrome/quinol oxidase subunit 1